MKISPAPLAGMRLVTGPLTLTSDQTTNSNVSLPFGVPGLSLNYTAGIRPLYVVFNGVISNVTAGQACVLALYEGTTVIYNRLVISAAANQQGCGDCGGFRFPAAGSIHSYGIQIHTGIGTGTARVHAGSWLALFEA